MSAKPKCPKCKQRQLNEIGIASKLNAEERDKWKARAEKWDALIRPESILPLQAAKDWRERAEELQDTLGLAQLAAQTWKHRAEAAEAERDEAKAKLRVMDSRMKQVHAALLASMSDEQLAQSVKAR